MDRETFNAELTAYKERGGDFAFVFGEQRLPVSYNAMTGTLGVKASDDSIMTVVDYNLDLYENLDRLTDKLLTKHPELTA